MDDPTPSAPSPRRDGRRRALSTLIAAAGATAGVVAVGRSASAGDDDAAAIGGNAVELGLDNTSDRSTNVLYDGAVAIQDGQQRGSSLVGAGQEPPNAADGNNVFPGALGGYGKGFVPNGVHGSTVTPPATASWRQTSQRRRGRRGHRRRVSAWRRRTVRRSTSCRCRERWSVHPPGRTSAVSCTSTPRARCGSPCPRSEVASVGCDWPHRRRRAPTTPSILPGRTTPPSRLCATWSAGSRRGAWRQRGRRARRCRHDIAPERRPAGATAAALNVTIVDPTAVNFVSIVAGGRGASETSTVNWSSSTEQIANSITVPISSQRTIDIICGRQAGTAHVIIDVFGYYL